RLPAHGLRPSPRLDKPRTDGESNQLPSTRTAQLRVDEGGRRGVGGHTLKIRRALSRSSRRARSTACASLQTPARTKSSASTFARMRRYILYFGRPNSSLYMSL